MRHNKSHQSHTTEHSMPPSSWSSSWWCSLDLHARSACYRRGNCILASSVVCRLVIWLLPPCLASSVATEHTSPLADKVKAFLANPSTFVAAAPVATAIAAALASAASPKTEAKGESEESGMAMGFWLITKSRPIQPALFINYGNQRLRFGWWAII